MKFYVTKGTITKETTGRRSKGRLKRKDNARRAGQKRLEQRNNHQEEIVGLAPIIANDLQPAIEVEADIEPIVNSQDLDNASQDQPMSPPPPPNTPPRSTPPNSASPSPPLPLSSPGPSRRGQPSPRAPRRSERTKELRNKKNACKEQKIEAHRLLQERVQETRRQLQVITIIYCEL